MRLDWLGSYKYITYCSFLSDFSGTFRWTDQRDCLLLREIRLVEPYLYKMGSKMAGQKWTEVAENINYDLFKQMSRDQRSIQEHFTKTRGWDFKSCSSGMVGESEGFPSLSGQSTQLRPCEAALMSSASTMGKDSDRTACDFG